MQKKLIALAIAGLASGIAFADSNVTIYGRADGGFVSRGGDSGSVKTKSTLNSIDSGIAGGSRLGFRGAEDLGNGVKAIFEFETGVNLDSSPASAAGTNSNGFSARHAYVGLTSSTLGTAVLGRLDGVRYGLALKYDPFAGGTVGQFGNLQRHQSRADNAVAYISPSFSGFNVTAAYSSNLTGNDSAAAGSQLATGATPAVKANTGRAGLWAIMPAYNNGPISVTYDHEEAKVEGTANSKLKIDVLGGSYNFGVAKAFAYWERVKANAGFGVWDQRAYALGASAPVMGDKLILKASFSKIQDKNDGLKTAGNISYGDLNKYAIGLQYNLSKRTSIYSDFAKINNKSGNGMGTMAYSAATGSLEGGVAPALSGFGTRGFDLGIAHTF